MLILHFLSVRRYTECWDQPYEMGSAIVPFYWGRAEERRGLMAGSKTQDKKVSELDLNPDRLRAVS